VPVPVPVPVLVLVCTLALLRAVKEQRPLLAVRAHPGADLPRLQRPGHQSVAEHHPALDIHLGRRRAAAPPQSQGFALVGALFIIPFILMYTAWSYYVFRGKVTHEHGYH